MQLWPAIDLLDGKCVRLRQGDYGDTTVFSDDPVDVAERWRDAGAAGIHLVDLDGARDGTLVNLSVVQRIRDKIEGVPCQLGGGVRDEAAIVRLLGLGVDRVIVGTRALREPDWLREMACRYPQQLIAGIDARDGQVATHGWLETSSVRAVDFAASFSTSPLAAVIYTDISRDGMMAGPNFAGIVAMQEALQLPLVASGGVTHLSDVVELARIGIPECIIGRALYEGSINLQEAIRALESV
ncbi:MAG: 1-(5-phosphoribosyl)-5-[(5-phosphoribosylamino)methylideneamino]imidazole-4-carboxamide isomerase [Planctomycetota bacterium]|nr:1-(5-phosphoribosyl)-5-[(5-phosphoribosylamino)methylideneamino]imidazole-4-carboxamide isomerase [Planctomycetota bacterium]